MAKDRKIHSKAATRNIQNLKKSQVNLGLQQPNLNLKLNHSRVCKIVDGQNRRTCTDQFGYQYSLLCPI